MKKLILALGLLVGACASLEAPVTWSDGPVEGVDDERASVIAALLSKANPTPVDLEAAALFQSLGHETNGICEGGGGCYCCKESPPDPGPPPRPPSALTGSGSSPKTDKTCCVCSSGTSCF